MQSPIQIPISKIGQWADTSAIQQKKRHFFLMRIISSLGILATLVSLLDFPPQRAILCTLIGMMILLSVLPFGSESERNWYNQRALAESIKTFEWRLLVGSQSVSAAEISRGMREISEPFLAKLSIENKVDCPGFDDSFSRYLEGTSGATFSSRKTIYLEERLKNQRDWYHQKAKIHGRNWWRLRTAYVSFLIVGLIFVALGQFLDSLIPVLLALGAFVAAENSASQNLLVASAYLIAEEELNAIIEQIPSVTEVQWSEFVNDAEESISREHVSWRASKGIFLGKRNDNK
jgi:hypothetical protein